MPYLMILGCVGFLFGTGGSALIGKTMGEGDRKHADRLFSMVICVTALSGLALGVLGIVLLRPVAELLGAEGELLENCVRYGRLILIANPAYVLQFAFQCLFATAGKPKLGLAVTVAAGVTNMVLDALFVGVFRWGIAGAAVATSLSQCVGGLLPLLYFLGKWNRSELHLTRFRFDGRALGRICGNGSSELMSNISMSLVGMLYNAQLMRYGGQNGIAAYGVLMYVSMIFHACFIGYAVGVSPVVSFHFGAQNRPELHSLLRKSLRLIGGSSIAMLAAGEALARPLGQIFVGYDEALLAMTVRAVPDLLLLVPARGRSHSWVVVLHGAERRPDVRTHLVSADARVPDRGRAPAAARAGAGRHLALHRVCGNHGRARDDGLPAGEAEKVRILKRSMNRCLALP